MPTQLVQQVCTLWLFFLATFHKRYLLSSELASCQLELYENLTYGPHVAYGSHIKLQHQKDIWPIMIILILQITIQLTSVGLTHTRPYYLIEKLLVEEQCKLQQADLYSQLAGVRIHSLVVSILSANPSLNCMPHSLGSKGRQDMVGEPQQVPTYHVRKHFGQTNESQLVYQTVTDSHLPIYHQRDAASS